MHLSVNIEPALNSAKIKKKESKIVVKTPTKNISHQVVISNSVKKITTKAIEAVEQLQTKVVIKATNKITLVISAELVANTTPLNSSLSHPRSPLI